MKIDTKEKVHELFEYRNGSLYWKIRPFAALLQDHNSKGSDEQPIFGINNATITLGDLRRALAATEHKP